MFSNRFGRIWAVSAACAWLATGCGLKVGEKPPSETAVDLGSRETACLSGGTQVLSGFLEGRGSDEEVGELLTCAGRSLDLFKNRTQGKAPGVYSPEELRNFLETYFLKRDAKIPDRMLRELMELKRVFLGGSARELTVGELERTRTFLSDLRVQAIRLRPLLPFQLERASHWSQEQLDWNVREIESVALELAQFLKGGGYEYSFSRFERLLKEVEAMAGEKTDASAQARSFRERLPLLKVLKAILISPDSQGISGKDWERIVLDGARWYGWMLRYTHARHRLEGGLFSPKGRDSLLSLAQSAYALLDDSLQRRPGEMVPFSELENLIDSLDPSLFRWSSFRGTYDIPPAHLKKLVRVAILRVLSGGNAGPEGRQAPGLTRAALRRGLELLEEWVEGQRYLDALWAKAAWGSADQTPTELSRDTLMGFSVEEVLGLGRADISQSKWNAIQRVHEIVQRKRPHYEGPAGEMFFVDPGNRVAKETLVRLHGLKLVAHLLVRSYAESPTRLDSGVTIDEADQFYLDLRDLGIDLRVFDPLDTSVARKRFFEADLFSFEGNGDGILSPDEAAGMLALLFSAKGQANRFHEAVARVCNRKSKIELRPIPVDFFGYEVVEASCYRQEFFKKVEDSFARLPKLLEYYTGLRREERMGFVRDLEDAARAHGFSSQPVDSADSERIVAVAQYLETLFLRFDLDRSGAIDAREAESAFPVIKRALQNATCQGGSCLEGDDFLRAVFTYLLAFGRPPGKLGLGTWMLARPFWSFQADRGDVLRVLAKLASKGQ